MSAPTLTLTIESTLENARILGMAVNKVCESLELDDVVRAHIELCVVEAVTNSIRHAYEGESSQEVSVRIVADPHCLELFVIDSGRPVPEDRKDAPELMLDEEDPDSVTEGGRGLFLIHTIMDEVKFSRDEGVNTLRMAKQLKSVQHCAETAEV